MPVIKINSNNRGGVLQKLAHMLVQLGSDQVLPAVKGRKIGSQPFMFMELVVGQNEVLVILQLIGIAPNGALEDYL